MRERWKNNPQRVKQNRSEYTISMGGKHTKYTHIKIRCFFSLPFAQIIKHCAMIVIHMILKLNSFLLSWSILLLSLYCSFCYAKLWLVSFVPFAGSWQSGYQQRPNEAMSFLGSMLAKTTHEHTRKSRSVFWWNFIFAKNFIKTLYQCSATALYVRCACHMQRSFTVLDIRYYRFHAIE